MCRLCKISALLPSQVYCKNPNVNSGCENKFQCKILKEYQQKEINIIFHIILSSNNLVRLDEQQGPTYNTGSYVQYPVIKNNRKEYERNICITESFCYTVEIGIICNIVSQ